MGVYYGMNGLWVPVGGQGGQAIDLSVITAAAGDVRQNKIFIDSSGQQITGTLIARNSANITSSNNVVTIPAGIYDSQVQKTVGTAKSAETYTPTTSNQTISAGYYLTGTQTIKGDSNLVSGNIKSGVSIFGVSGSLESKAVAKIVDFCSDGLDDYAFNFSLDTPISNIEAIYFTHIQTDGNYSVIPPESYYDNDISNYIEYILYTNDIKFAITANPPTAASSYGDPSMSVITNVLQQSPSIISIYFKDRNFLNNYNPSYSGTEKFIGYVIGEKYSGNTYYMKNIAASESNWLYGGGTNKFTSTWRTRWVISRFYFDFISSSTITISFSATNPGTEYLIIGNLNQSLNDNRYVDDSFYYYKSYSSNINPIINYTIPQGKSYIDVKVCTDGNGYIESDFSFSISI